ncbi:LOB domain-containing protein 4 [Platanthera guangdongensis]|uniref:LOB domain-containing protein 4 n=1 Tax=Platanthera guangdongensis TaxID=2320717 RepID=A0ABR2M5H1_9ASPA
MHLTDTSAAAAAASSFSHPIPSPAAAPPCAACKILRRRCVEKCLLAPHFPPSEPLKFTTAHRIFGASNIIKLLNELPERDRADAVSSIVYEANARIRDPVYGCAGTVFMLQKQAAELQAQVARARADLIHVQTQHTNLLAVLMASSSMQTSAGHLPATDSPGFFYDGYAGDDSSGDGSVWEAFMWA